MQKLIMPFKKQMMLCGYKNIQYTKHWGYPHYGIDISSIQGKAGTDWAIYASGNGTVIACGFDNSGGNVVVVKYDDCYNHATKATQSLIARYMHLASISVKAGQAVSTGEVIGTEGNTKTADYHLHLEFDTDINYPCYSPQVSSKDDKLTVSQGNILRKGADTCINPSYVLHIGAGQAIVKPTYNPAWLNKEDFSIPVVEGKPVPPVTDNTEQKVQKAINTIQAKASIDEKTIEFLLCYKHGEDLLIRLASAMKK